MPACLKLELGFAVPSDVELDSEHLLRLGRNRTNDIVLHDQHASRYHAEIYHEGSSWYLRDLNTTNGTKINGGKIKEPTVLTHGDLLGIGQVRLRFSCPIISGEHAVRTPPEELPVSVPSCDATTFEADDLTALVRFINVAVLESTPNGLVRHALETVNQQIRPVLCCFQSLDRLTRLDPVSRLVLPAGANPDVDLLRAVARPVRDSGRPLWVRSPIVPQPMSLDLHGYTDALCVPLLSDEDGSSSREMLGLLYVFHDRRLNDRQVHFCQILADCMGHNLQAQRVRRALEAENLRYRGGVRMSGRSDQIIGRSDALSQVRVRIRRLADGISPVLITGPTGAGKELVALALHRASRRNVGPFIEVNCASVPVQLADSLFFGHVAGAFSGAVSNQIGYLQQADEGVLFLDEVADLDPEVQGKLLRLFECKDNRISFMPVGGHEPVHVSVRIVAATHRDLSQLVSEKKFREDLYFRLSVTTIEVPSLLEHAEDIPDLVRHFMERLNQEYYRHADKVTISDEAVAELQKYSWPGNVRQLRAILEQAVAMAEPGDQIEPHNLCLPSVDRSTVQLSSTSVLPTLNVEELEAMAIQAAVQQTNTMIQAAALLGMHRDTLRSKWEKIHKQGKE